MFVFICLCILIQVIPLNIVVLSKFSISMRDNVYPTHYSNHRTGQVIFEAITRLIYNAVGIYASRHARYNEVDLYFYDANLGPSGQGPSWIQGPSFEQTW